MFKNLDGFKKIKEDKDVTVMQHPKGHTISIAMKALPAIHKRQLQALPMACGGQVQKYAEGTADASNDQNQTPVEAPAEEQAPSDQNQTPVPQGASGSWDEPAPDQQSAPQAAVPSGDQAVNPQQQSLGGLDNVSPESMYNLGASSLANTAKSARGQAADEKSALENYQTNLNDEVSKWNTSQAEMVNQLKATLKDVGYGQINPKQYQQNMSAPQKVAAAIGLFLGGFSTPFTHQGNPALQMLNQQIDRDIDAQKAGLNNKLNIYHANLDQYKNAAAAEAMTRATMLGVYANKIKMAALNNADPAIQAKVDAGVMALQQQAYPLLQRAHFLSQTQGINDRAQGGQLSALPPEQLVKYSGASPDDQNKMYAEIKDLQNINSIRKPSMDAFDQAAREVRPMTGGTGTSLTAFVPGLDSPAQKQWQGLANTTVKDVEGTARQAAFDNLAHSFKPQMGDSDATIALKRRGWQQYLDSHSAAPVSKGYGIDLQSYHSTSPMASPDIKVVNGVRYMRGPGNKAIPVK